MLMTLSAGLGGWNEEDTQTSIRSKTGWILFVPAAALIDTEGRTVNARKTVVLDGTEQWYRIDCRSGDRCDPPKILL